jgi:hypothetical protein
MERKKIMKVALNISIIFLPLLVIVFFLAPPSRAQEAGSEGLMMTYEEFGVLTPPWWAQVGPHGIIKIYESTFNEFGNSLGTIRRSGTHPIRKRACIPVLGCHTVTLCSGEWTVNISDLDFTITTEGINVTGQVSGTYNCWITIPFPGTVAASADVTYSEDQRAVRVDIGTLSISVPILGTINIPSINPSESFPVDTAHFYFETAMGPERLRLTPYNISLTKRNGCIELQGNAVLW